MVAKAANALRIVDVLAKYSGSRSYILEPPKAKRKPMGGNLSPSVARGQ